MFVREEPFSYNSFRNEWTPDALLEDEVFGRMTVHGLPRAEQLPMRRAGARDAIVGRRLYDAHIAEVARSTGAGVVAPTIAATFFPRYGLRVETPAEFLATVKKKPR